jgi:predicted alpha/beta hydrolase
MKNNLETEQEIRQESIFIELNPTDKLHLKRIFVSQGGPVVFMLHGSIENGKIFYSSSGKGLAPYLARNGYDVFIADLRGRGQGTPKFSRNSRTGQTESITEEIPAFLNEIQKLRGNTLQHWIGHSWGGIILLSFFLRFAHYRPLVKSMVFFGTRRSITVFNLKKLININFFWFFFARILTFFYGYLPAVKFGFGSDNESRKSHKQSIPWVKGKPWVDQQDSFDYGGEIKKAGLPPLLFLTGSSDTDLGNQIDVNNFVREVGNEKSEFRLISKEKGFLHDYGHIDILTHPDSVGDHFPLVLKWFESNES